jgi:hypothetical protein
VDAEINNVIYMELYSVAEMADGKYQKTYVAGSIDQENTVVEVPITARRVKWGGVEWNVNCHSKTKGTVFTES